MINDESLSKSPTEGSRGITDQKIRLKMILSGLLKQKMKF